MAPTLDHPEAIQEVLDSDREVADGPRRGRTGLTVLPGVFLLLLLVSSTFFDGAYQLRNWGPVALFTLASLAVLAAFGTRHPVSRPAGVALAALWLLAAYTALTALWSDAPARAWEDANRWLLYAALTAVAVRAIPGRREARILGFGLILALAVLGTALVVALNVDGLNLFLAGRLDAPVGYRNATAALFALGFWPFVTVAAGRGFPRGLRALALGQAALSLGLVFLTQSRGIALGLVIGALVALGAGPDRVRRAGVTVLAAAGVAAASSLLLAPWDAFDGGRGTVTAANVASAADGLAILLIGGTLVGAVVALLDQGLRMHSPVVRYVRTAARVSLVVLLLGVVVGGLAAMGNPVTFGREKIDEFRGTDTTVRGNRITRTSGPRYDLWRVAWGGFTSHPLAGEGDGSYPTRYYRERHSNRNVDNPHSLVLALLGDLGLIGFGLFLVFLTAITVAIVRGWARAPIPARQLTTGLAAAAAVALAQSFVDWTWLIPGVTAIAFFALGVGTRLVDQPPAESRRPSLPWRALTAAGLAAAAVSVLLAILGDFELRRARAAADRSTDTQLSAARAAQKLNPLAVQPRWLEASALESRGDVAGARRRLEDALADEPKSFTTMAVLGDLEARAGNRREALRWYERALELNPRDTGLRRLARGQYQPG